MRIVSIFCLHSQTLQLLIAVDDKEKAFEHLVREHKGTIYTVCYMFSKDPDEANDLFQDTLIHLWMGFDKFRGESRVETWVWRVALNTCISSDRKKKRAGERIPLDMDVNLFADNDDDSKQIRQLYNRIGKLGVMDRAIILLWLENMSYDDIGAIVGISPKNVSVKLVRIRQQLIEMSKNKNS